MSTIRDVEHIDMRGESPDSVNDEEVITGGLVIDGRRMYFGSYCEKDRAYGITVEVSRINISLEDGCD